MKQWTSKWGQVSFGYHPTGLGWAEYMAWHRIVSTRTSQWTTRDLLWPQEWGYAYVDDNPTTWVDPEGLQSFPPKPPQPKQPSKSPGPLDKYLPRKRPPTRFGPPTPVICICPIRPEEKVRFWYKGMQPKSKKYRCYFQACISHCSRLDSNATAAYHLCINAKFDVTFILNAYPACTKGNPAWEDCGKRLVAPGGQWSTGANGNDSGYPDPHWQDPIGKNFCKVECRMRACCDFNHFEYYQYERDLQSCYQKYG